MRKLSYEKLAYVYGIIVFLSLMNAAIAGYGASQAGKCYMSIGALPLEATRDPDCDPTRLSSYQSTDKKWIAIGLTSVSIAGLSGIAGMALLVSRK